MNEDEWLEGAFESEETEWPDEDYSGCYEDDYEEYYEDYINDYADKCAFLDNR